MARLTGMKLALALLLLATPAFADGFGYQVQNSPSITRTLSSPRYGTSSNYHRHGYHSHRYLPRREVTTIERDGNRTRIETKRYYQEGGTARMKTSSGKWAR